MTIVVVGDAKRWAMVKITYGIRGELKLGHKWVLVDTKVLQWMIEKWTQKGSLIWKLNTEILNLTSIFFF